MAYAGPCALWTIRRAGFVRCGLLAAAPALRIPDRARRPPKATQGAQAVHHAVEGVYLVVDLADERGARYFFELFEFRNGRGESLENIDIKDAFKAVYTNKLFHQALELD